MYYGVFFMAWKKLAAWPAVEKVPTNRRNIAKMPIHTTFHSTGKKHTVCDKIDGQYDGMMTIYSDDGTYAGYRYYSKGERTDGRTHTFFNDDGSIFVSIKKVATEDDSLVDGA